MGPHLGADDDHLNDTREMFWYRCRTDAGWRWPCPARASPNIDLPAVRPMWVAWPFRRQQPQTGIAVAAPAAEAERPRVMPSTAATAMRHRGKRVATWDI